jgi:hypothetical protein
MQCDCLVVADVAPAFAFACQELRVETPGDDRVDYNVVVAVDIEFFRDYEELAVSTVGACAVNLIRFVMDRVGIDFLTD